LRHFPSMLRHIPAAIFLRHFPSTMRHIPAGGFTTFSADCDIFRRQCDIFRRLWRFPAMRHFPALHPPIYLIAYWYSCFKTIMLILIKRYLIEIINNQCKYPLSFLSKNMQHVTDALSPLKSMRLLLLNIHSNTDVIL